MYATVSLPPVPVVQPLFFQHLSASAWWTLRSDRPSPASAMLRDILSFGSSVALKSVCFSVAVFAAYTSPKPLPVLMTPGVACCAPPPPPPGRGDPEREPGPQKEKRRAADAPSALPRHLGLVPALHRASFRE